MRGSYRRKQKSRFPLSKSLLILTMLLVILLSSVSIISPYWAAYKKSCTTKNEIDVWKQKIPTESTESSNSSEQTESPPQYQDLYRSMCDYNNEIFKNGQKDLKDAWSYQAEIYDLSKYGMDTDIFGLVSIPKLDVEMPLYLGANYYNLDRGFAQLSQTSMPIGGNNSNCVIAGHRGWHSEPYLIDIEDLEIGDSVFIQNPWETLEYRVSEIKLIYPHEVEQLYIQKGKDMVTLLTCHPYRVNSHRYIVYCERYTNDSLKAEETSETNISTETTRSPVTTKTSVTITASEGLTFESSQKIIFFANCFPLICMGIGFLILFVVVVIIILKRRKK